LAKLTVKGRTWEEAVDRMHRSLEEYVIRGVKTTIPFYMRMMKDESFRSGQFDTSYIEKNLERLNYRDERNRMDLVLAIAAAVSAHVRR